MWKTNEIVLVMQQDRELGGLNLDARENRIFSNLRTKVTNNV